MNEIDRSKSEMFEWVRSILFAVLLAVIIRAFLFEPFLVSGGSMLPTLEDRERLVVSKSQYYFREPAHGEIVVFKVPDGRDFIKRVIGVPGDVVEINPNGLFINGNLISEPYINNKARDYYGPVKVPEGKIFVLGDNRNYSQDSRHEDVGFVSLEKVKGKAVFVFWPPGNFRLTQHEEEVN